jgi:hypothetical protein
MLIFEVPFCFWHMRISNKFWSNFIDVDFDFSMNPEKLLCSSQF